MKYVVYVDCDAQTLGEGGYLAHVPALPGCVGRGLSKKEAVARCEENLRAYLALLIHSGASGVPRETESLQFEVHECGGPTLPSDYNPLMRNEAEELVQWMEVSRDELLEYVSKLPPESLEYKPNPNGWSIREILEHIAESDWYFVQRLHRWPGDVFEKLAATRALLVNSMRNLTDEERGRVNVHNDVDWTARRIARRALEHEREHAQQIKELAERYKREEI